MADTPAPAMTDATTPTPKPFRIWPEHCAFRKNGTPVVGTMGSTIRQVIIIDTATWKRMVGEIPGMATAQFEVPNYE